jgi:serine O-acetyltransferase
MGAKPFMFKRMIEDIDAIRARDPAARSRFEVFIAYPGFHAVRWHRLANWFWRNGMRLMGRWTSHWGRWLTGIEIHPGARIGERLFIDHGMGVVIGETAEVGDDVMLYHGVTLGGRQREGGKRHPTLEDGVAVGAGAKILGPITIGAHSVVGANAVVTRDAPADSVLVGVPAKPRSRRVGEDTRAILTAPEYSI